MGAIVLVVFLGADVVVIVVVGGEISIGGGVEVGRGGTVDERVFASLALVEVERAGGAECADGGQIGRRLGLREAAWPLRASSALRWHVGV